MDESALVAVIEHAIDQALDRRNRIDADTHRTHHDYVARLIERDRRRTERWERVRVHVYGWGAVTALGGLIYAVGDLLREFVHNLFRAKGGP